MSLRHFWVLLVLLLLATRSEAQHQPGLADTPFAFFEHFGEEQGIPGRVNLIRQDRQGYLWCALEHKGLLRFDGVQFRLYTNDPDDPNSLPNNAIEDMLVDQSGLIWLSTKSGMIRFDPVSEHFSLVPCSVSETFTKLFEDHSHRIWAGTYDAGLTFFDPRLDSMVGWRGEHCRDGYTGHAGPTDCIGAFIQLTGGADGTLWAIGVREGEGGAVFHAVAYLDPSRRTLTYFSIEPFYKKNAGSVGDLKVLAFFLDEKNQHIWMGGYGSGLFQFSINNHTWQRYDLNPPGQNNPANNFIYDIQPKNDSTLWLATETGLKVFSTTRRQWAGFNPHPTQAWDAHKLSHRVVFRDKSGATWFGTDNGISRLDPFRQQFPTNPMLADTFGAQAIAEYMPTGERLFAAWRGDGFFRVFARHLRTGKTRQAKQRLHFTPNDVACVHQLFVAPDGRIWVLLNKGIGWLDPVTLRLTIPDQPIANHLPCYSACRTASLWPRQMMPDAEGNLWIATFGSGLIRYTPGTGQFWRPPELPLVEGARREFNDFGTSIFCDTTGRIFWGEHGTGMEMWDRTQKTRTLFQPKAKNSRGYRGHFTNCIGPDAAGNLWFGTDQGLCRYLPGLPPDSAFEHVRGLQESVLRVVPDGQGRLWGSTPKGLICYDPRCKIWRKFGEKEGLVVFLDKHTPLFRDSDGQIWLGSFLRFNPADILLDPPPAKPVITSFKIYDQARPLPAPTEVNGQQVFPEIRLSPDQEVFSIAIGTLGFTAPEQTRLLYRLRADDPWIEAGAQRTFTFNRLPGGRYRFELKAVGADGAESSHSAVLPLRIVPPFYRTVWFWLLCLAAVGGGLFTLFRYREILRLRQERLRLRIARDLHDEVGSTLSSISILSASALRGVEKDLDKARLGNIGEKARAALDSISDIVWSVNPENDSMEKALTRMSAYAAEMLENVGAELRFEVGAGVESLSLPMEKRKDFYLIFKEAIHNCAKYARANHVEVAIKKEDNRLILRIKDDGVGFKMEGMEPGARGLGGNGLRNMQSRAAAMGAELEVTSAPGTGTEVRLALPV